MMFECFHPCSECGHPCDYVIPLVNGKHKKELCTEQFDGVGCDLESGHNGNHMTQWV